MIRDPVSGFVYPQAWVERCRTPDLLDAVGQGLAVLTASGKVLRRGYTTGTTAAGAAKAAVLSLQDSVRDVSLTLPCGIEVTVPVTAEGGFASCVKDAGDHEHDVTEGVEILAQASPREKISLVCGPGIGRFVRDTPRYHKGDPALSVPARESVLRGIQEAVDLTGLMGAEIVLSIPEGSALARHTLNARMGIEGGISILGTTGLVEPWDVHLRDTVQKRLADAENPVLTTGRLGLRYARLFYPDREVILVGSNIQEALAQAKGSLILCGLPGLILRAIDPHLLDGTGYATIEEFSSSPDFYPIMQKALDTFKRARPRVRVVLFTRDGSILGDSG
jgi:cobalt-precorrin-5B (C1)-methyltransferase